MLSISQFSEVCHLSPQTLRFYHSEGLLVPAQIDEQTGYRSYLPEQAERAMMITVLRGTGMSVQLVRRALDEPDAASALLQQHHAEVQRQRQAQDEAVGDAHRFLAAWPEPRECRAPATTVVSKLVPGQAAGGDEYDWAAAEAAVTATVAAVVETVESCGALVSGTPWRTWAAETPEQKRQGVTAEGPHWLVKIPVTADEKVLAALPGDLEVQTFEARDEVSIFIPGRSSSAKFTTALSRLMTHPLDNAFADVSRMRQVLHADGVETTLAICTLDETDAAG